MGVHTTYNPKYIKELTKYCEECLDNYVNNDFADETDEDSNIVNGYGKKKIRRYKRLVRLPTVFGFAARIGVNTSTINRWEAKFPEFSSALRLAKDICASITVEAAANGLIRPNVAKLIMLNITDWNDKILHDFKGGLTLEQIVGESFKKND